MSRHFAVRLWNFYYVHSNQPWLTPNKAIYYGRNHIYGIQLYIILGPIQFNFDLHFDRTA